MLCSVLLSVCGPINVAETSEDCDLKAQSEAAGITKPKILNIFTCGEATQVNGRCLTFFSFWENLVKSDSYRPERQGIIGNHGH